MPARTLADGFANMVWMQDMISKKKSKETIEEEEAPAPTNPALAGVQKQKKSGSWM